MPDYDVQCAACGHTSSESVKLAALDAWDAAARCPECQAGDRTYRRVILQAPMSRMGGEGSARSETARKLSVKAAFGRSSIKGEMLQKSKDRVDPEQKAACFEGAKKG